MKFYNLKNCGYNFRQSLEEAPTAKELHLFLNGMNGKFKRLVDYNSDNDVSENDCISGKRSMHYRGKRISMARICYLWFIGDISPNTSLVTRRCGTEYCVRPEHLQTICKEEKEPICADI